MYHADQDVLALAVLYDSGLIVPAMFHGAQAVEKYLKALALALTVPDEHLRASGPPKWMWTHDLVQIADRCSPSLPSYGTQGVRDKLGRFSTFNENARYPWSKSPSGFVLSRDLDDLKELILRLRRDLPIVVDDYVLGLAVRGHFHREPKRPANQGGLSGEQSAVPALRRLFGDADLHSLVRW